LRTESSGARRAHATDRENRTTTSHSAYHGIDQIPALQYRDVRGSAKLSIVCTRSRFRAHRLMAGHSGTLLAFLLDPLEPGFLAKLEQAREFVEDLRPHRRRPAGR
jgi:hypothetical protein